jgi:enamine deaminase RidA (YjgF/YER057c/UK114 family)
VLFFRMLDEGSAVQRSRSGTRFEKMAAYSRAARVSNVVAVSGTAALDEDGAALFPGDAGAQTREALLRALAAAAELGAARSDVIRTRILLVQGADWRGPVEAHGELFAGVDPANTTVYVAGMIPEGCLVEVELDAVLDVAS